MTEKKLTVRYSVLQGFYWMLAALSIVYMVPILEDKGFSSIEIGCLNAFRYTVMIIFQPWLASFVDRHVEKISLLLIIKIMVAVGLFATTAFWLIGPAFSSTLILFFFFGMTICCLEPMINSVSLQYIHQGKNVNYTFARAVGAFTWAVFCVFAGRFADCLGAQNLLGLQVVLLVLIGVTMFFMEPLKKERNTAKSSFSSQVHTVRFLLRYYHKYVLFLFACMLIYMGYSMNTIFLIDKVVMLGGTHTDYGLSQFILAIAELPIMLCFSKFRRYVSLDRMMLLCALFCVLRAFCTAHAQNVEEIIAFQILEVFGLSIYYSGSIYFIMENLPEGDGVKGMALLSVATAGVGEMAASFVGGFIEAFYGVSALMSVSVVISVLGFFVMIGMSSIGNYVNGRCRRYRCRRGAGFSRYQ